jgi:hypothetical protein
MMNQRSIPIVRFTVAVMMLMFALTSYAQWTPNSNSTTVAISRTGAVGVGTSGSPSNQLHVFGTSSLDGIAVDGSTNPALNLRNNGSIKGYLGLATAVNAFFTGSAVNDLILQSSGARVLIGQGSGAPTLTVSASTMTSALGANQQYSATRSDLVVAPSVAQDATANLYSHYASASIPSGNTAAVGQVYGLFAGSTNNGGGTPGGLYGTVGWAYNAGSGSSVGAVVGAGAYTESDTGSVGSLMNFQGYGGVYGGAVTNLYGMNLQTNNVSGTVTNSYGIFVAPSGNATNRYELYLQDVAGTVTNDFALYQAGATRKSYFAGTVGVGTTTPKLSLDVKAAGVGFPANSGTTQTGNLRLSQGIGTGVLDFGIAGTSQLGAWLQATASDNLSNHYDILLNPNGGRVGVALQAANATLDVGGTIHATGVITSDAGINAVYQDLAEWVPVTQSVVSGTVVVLNPSKGSEVMPSATAYDTTVAGVVSEHPGITLGKAGADKAQIATTGRVKVRVDATRNPIRVGDLLVTSDVAGTAMRSVPVQVSGLSMHRPGTIIGKALEPLSDGVGEILVLLSLQ